MVACGTGSVSLAGRRDCHRVPCLQADTLRDHSSPRTGFRMRTEVVPFTVMKPKTRVDLVPAYTKTVMKTKLETVYDEQTRNVCKPVFDTVFETHASPSVSPSVKRRWSASHFEFAGRSRRRDR